MYRGTTLISFDYVNSYHASLHSEITASNRSIFQIKDPPNVDSRGEFARGFHKMLPVTAFIPF